MKREIIYVDDLAQLMGTTEASIRSNIQRSAWPGAIPQPFRCGRKWAWRICNIEAWLEDKATVFTPTKKRKCGRPSKTASILSR